MQDGDDDRLEASSWQGAPGRQAVLDPPRYVVGLLVFLLAGIGGMVTHSRSDEAVDIPRGGI